MKLRVGSIIGVVFAVIWLSIVGLYGLSGLIGLVTGAIYLPSKNGGGGTITGITARIVSAVILVICTSIIWTILSVWKKSRHRRKRDWSKPYDPRLDNNNDQPGS